MKLHLPTSISITRPATGRPRPYRDWYMLLLVALIFLLISTAWNVWFFVRTTSGESAELEQPDEQDTPERLIEKAQEVFAERAAEEARYRSEYRFIDPSR